MINTTLLTQRLACALVPGGPARVGTGAVLLAHAALRPTAGWMNRRATPPARQWRTARIRTLCRAECELHR